MQRCCLLLAAILFLLHHHHATSVTDTDTLAASLKRNWKLVSTDRAKYVLAFFAPNPNDMGCTYREIWFNNIPVRTVGWVTNSQSPILGGVDAVPRQRKPGHRRGRDHTDHDQ